MRLTPCTSCARHIQFEDPICRFCGATREPRVAPSTPALPRTGRAAIVAFGLMATAGATSGCDPESGPSPDAAVVGEMDAPEEVDARVIGAPDAAYGGPPLDAHVEPTDDAHVTPDVDAGPVDSDAGSRPDAGGIAPAYGGPPDP